MQKIKSNRKAGTAKTGITSSRKQAQGKTVKCVRKPLTPEQRKRKNEQDRRRKAAKRAMERSSSTTEEQCGKGHGSGCYCTDGGCRAAPRARTPEEVFTEIGRLIVEEVAARAGLPVDGRMSQVVLRGVADIHGSSACRCRADREPTAPGTYWRSPEPGVSQRLTVFPDGSRVKLTVVDCSPDKDRLGQIRRDVSAIVDAHRDCE